MLLKKIMPKMSDLKQEKLNTATNKRLSWIDFARGLGIFLVVFGHLELPYSSPFFEARTVNTMLVSSFHVPLFFFLSGLCFSAGKKPREFIARKVQTLLVPWLFFSVIWCVFKCVLAYIDGELTLQFALGTAVNFLLQKRLYAIWFLTAVFLTEVVFYIIVRLCRDKEIAIIAAAAIALCAGLLYKHYIGKFLYWELDVVPLAIPFFAVGYLCKRFRNYELNGRGAPAAVALALFVIGQLINAFNCRHFDKHFISMYNNEYCNYLLFFVSALCGITATVIISMLLQNRFSFVKYVGKSSLVFFGLHQIIFIIIERLLSNQSFSDLQLTLIWVGAFFLAFAVLTPLNELLTKTKLRVLLGKTK